MKFYFTCIFLLGVYSIKSQDSLLFKIANEQQQQGNFIAAMVQYERVLYGNDNQLSVFRAIQEKTSCLKQMGDFNSACGFIKSTIQMVQTDSLKAIIYQEWITCSYLANQLDEAELLIEQASFNYANFININQCTFIKILCLNEQNKWKDAENVYTKWLVKNHLDSNQSALIYQNIPHLKNENKAQWLATLIPGAGQFYAGKPWEGITSILLQGAGAAYCISSFLEKYYLSAALIGGGIAGSFHNGSVRRSEELIKQYNKRVSAKFNEMARDKILAQVQSFL